MMGSALAGLSLSSSWEAGAVVIAVPILVWVLWSGSLARLSITPAITLTVLGFLFSESVDAAQFSLRSDVIKIMAELALAIVLFNDAAGLSLREFRRVGGLSSRLLGIGFPLTVGLSFLVAWLLFPTAGLWVCLLIAAATSPTDAALGAPIMEDVRIPQRVREGLNVESGLNDGLCTPIVNVALAGAIAAISGTGGWEASPLQELAIGAAVGVAIGLVIGGLMTLSGRRGWSTPAVLPIATPACALVSYGLAVELGGNGFVAAFLGGLAFGTQQVVRSRPTLRFSKRIGQLLSLIVWFLVGAVLVQVLGDVTWQSVAFAVLALTLARMIPVALALLGTGLDRRTVLLVGWFGPRGLASVVFAVLAFSQLPTDPGDLVLGTVMATVILSVLAHGLSSVPLVGLLSRRSGAG